MKKIYTIKNLILLFFLFAGFSLQASHDVFIKWGDVIKGESQDDTHKGWSELQSIEFGLENSIEIPSSSGRTQTGRAEAKELTLTKKLDLASAELAQHLVAGKTIEGDVVIHFVRSGGNAGKSAGSFLTVKLKDVVIVDQSLSTSDGDDIVEETLVLKYASIEYAYRKQTAEGKLGAKKEFKWDFIKNKPE